MLNKKYDFFNIPVKIKKSKTKSQEINEEEINKMFNKNVHSVLDFSTEGFDSEKEFLVI